MKHNGFCLKLFNLRLGDPATKSGANSHPVVSIGISLKGDTEEPDWKAHIPYENLQELIDALEDAKARFKG
jgi:hypothetical protein